MGSDSLAETGVEDNGRIPETAKAKQRKNAVPIHRGTEAFTEM
jgi:hypothetical protein